MRRRLLPNNVRMRLTLGYALALSLALSIYSLCLFGLYRSNLYSDLDLKLRGHVEASDDSLEALIGGHPSDSALDAEDWLTEIWSTAGSRVYTSGIASDYPLGELRNGCADRFSATNVTLAGGLKVRVLCQESSTHKGSYFIRAGRVRERVEDQLRSFGGLELLGMPIIVVLSALLGYLLARRALGPVARLTAAARSITASRLSERLPVQNPQDELGQLAEAFNGTFQNLERSFHQMRRFTSDASHELRTPLTAIRTMGEVALRTRGSGKDPYDTIGSILEETQNLQNLCETLLLLSRGDAGQLRLTLTPTEMKPLVDDIVDLLSVLAEEKQQHIEVSAEIGVVAEVDSQLIKRAIGNLLDNAIKYSPPGRSIQVTAADCGTSVQISVIDRGPGIPEAHLAHIFERFYRVDAARSKVASAGGGVGLGLSIAQWAVHLHNGEIHVASRPGDGSTFTIELPKIQG